MAEKPKFKKKGKTHDSFYIGGDQIKVAGRRLHARISNIRQDTLHKITTWISSFHSEAGIEHLNVKGVASFRTEI